MEYVRVETTYYKLVEKPLVNGAIEKRLIEWSLNILKSDNIDLSAIPKYDGFIDFKVSGRHNYFFNLHGYIKTKEKVLGFKSLRTVYIKKELEDNGAPFAEESEKERNDTILDERSLQLHIKKNALKKISKESDILLENRKAEREAHRINIEKIDSDFFGLEKTAFQIITSIHTGSKIAYLVGKSKKGDLYESGYFGGMYQSKILTLYRFEVLNEEKEIIYMEKMDVDSAIKHFKRIS